MGDTWKNGSRLVKCVILGKMGHIWENGSHLEKWVTIVKTVTLG